MRRAPALTAAPKAPRHAGKPLWLKWYGTQRWRRRAKHQLEVEPLCHACRARGLVEAATIADHVEHHGGDEGRFWTGELQSLCAGCHSSKSLVDRAARRTGRPPRVKGCDAHGHPTDPNHFWNRT
jgi:5-methylcytosine-specific restriction enzyme A